MLSHTLSKVETANNRRNKSFGQHYVGAGPAWPQNSLIWDHTLLLDLSGVVMSGPAPGPVPALLTRGGLGASN